MTLNLNSIINMDKLTKICAVVGGIWGLINGIIILFYIRTYVFLGGDVWNYYFTQIPITFKILFLPTYLAHQIIFLPLLELESSISISPSTIIFFLIFLLVAIIMPILFGIGISLLAANLIDKGKKMLKK